MITVSVRFFSVLADIAKARKITISLDRDIATLKDIIEVLEKKIPQLSHLEDKIRIMYLVNGEPSSHDRLIRNGDEIALIPPTSGG